MSLIDIFSGTLNIDPNVRLISEQQLIEARKETSFIFALLDVINSEHDVSISMSASLFLKKTIVDCWNNRLTHQRSQSSSFSDSQGSDSTSSVCFTIVQKNLFKEKLLKTLVNISNHSILSHLVSILGFIITSDPFPQSWPDLIANISQLLESPDPKHVYCGVISLIEVLRYYRWHDHNAETDNKNQIINLFLPKLVALATSLVQQVGNQNEQDKERTGELVWKILKAYKQSIGYELNSFLQTREELEKWVNLFLYIITLCEGNDKETGDAASPVERTSAIISLESNSWRKCRKWSFESINLLFVRYSVLPRITNFRRHNYQEFSQLFLSSFASEICNLYINNVKKLPEEVQPESSAVISQSNKHSYKLIAIFLENCLRIDPLWNIVHSNLELILSKLIFLNLRLSQQDLYSYQYEPDQFYYENLSSDADILLTAKGAAHSFVCSLVFHRDSIALPGILMTVNNILKMHTNNLTDLQCCLDVDSALQIMCAISDANATKQSPIILNQMGQFISNYILPIFYKSNQTFLYSRSFQIITTYSSIIHLSNDLLLPINENIIKSLDSPDILTQITSILALQSLLKYDYIVHLQSSNIQQTMEKILVLYDNDVVSETLSNVMEELVATFSRELIPFAFKLCQHLSNQLLTILQELVENQQDNEQQPDYQFLDEKAENAQHILSTLSTLLNSFQDYGNEVNGLEETIANIVKPVFQSGEIDLYPDVVELIDIIILTNKSVSEGLWTSVFNTFYESFKKEPLNHIDAIIPCISNFVAYGGIGITKERLENLFEMIHFAISNHDVEIHVKQNASFIIQLILLTLPDCANYSVTDLIPFIIEMPGRSLNMIVAALFRDSRKSLNSLINSFDEFLSEWTTVIITDQQELKLNIGAALKLISIRDGLSLQQRAVLFKFLINIITKLQPSIIDDGTAVRSKTFGFIDESINFQTRDSFESDFGVEDELPPALGLAIDNINVKGMYIEIIKGLERNEYETLLGGLNEKEKVVNFSILGGQG